MLAGGIDEEEWCWPIEHLIRSIVSLTRIFDPPVWLTCILVASDLVLPQGRRTESIKCIDRRGSTPSLIAAQMDGSRHRKVDMLARTRESVDRLFG